MTALTIHQPEHLAQGEGHSVQDYLWAAKEQYDLALGCAKQSVQHVWLMGKALAEAKAKHKLRKQELGKDEPNWELLLKGIGLSVASDNRARRLFQAFPNVEQVQGKGIMEAYQEAGISRLPLPKAEESDNSHTNENRDQRESVANDSSQIAANRGDEVVKTEAANDSSTDEEDSNEEAFDSDGEDLENQRSYVDMLHDISADMEVMRNRIDNLSDEETKAALAEVELIVKYAIDIKIRLEEGVDDAA